MAEEMDRGPGTRRKKLLTRRAFRAEAQGTRAFNGPAVVQWLHTKWEREHNVTFKVLPN